MIKQLKLLLIGTSLGIVLYAISQDLLRVALFLAIIWLLWRRQLGLRKTDVEDKQMNKQVSKNLVTLIIGGSVIVGFLAGVAIGLGDGMGPVSFVSLLPWLGGLVSLPALLLALKEERE